MALVCVCSENRPYRSPLADATNSDVKNSGSGHCSAATKCCASKEDLMGTAQPASSARGACAPSREASSGLSSGSQSQSQSRRRLPARPLSSCRPVRQRIEEPPRSSPPRSSLPDLLDGLSSAHPPLIEHIMSFVDEDQTFYQQMWDLQVEVKVSPDYMSLQPDLNDGMRIILIDWLADVLRKYGLSSSTLFLTVSLVDLFLSKVTVPRNRLQLVGVAACSLASKYNERDAPSLDSLAYVTANTYTVNEIKAMECQLLSALDFRVPRSNAGVFVERLLGLLQHRMDAVQCEAVRYLAELALLDLRCLSHGPSAVAAAALYVSQKLFAQEPLWPSCMAQLAWHDEPALKPCATALWELLVTDLAPNCKAITRKFADKSHSCVSQLVTNRLAVLRA
eukprot:TRINITY_DN16706_c0_g2_i1.p1 TRINITY_DN16706_c0_g2~~TRINITY_DN16706_c0_g2_i1.p1  ORF type:complete len:394 (-),score=68.13 TRINITY_DN16706_c0_g2_i1:98-1279(-)